MRTAFTLLLILHALIHLMGVAKAFGLAALPQLSMPISRPMGGLWLLATLLLLAAAVALWAAPRVFWILGAAGLVASQWVIIASWGDARFGSIANLLLLCAVVYGTWAWGPLGLRAAYSHQVSSGLASLAAQPAAVVTEADLTPLPPPVQRYLRFAGVLGQPRLQGFSARMSGRIRGAADAAWMPFTAEQYNFYNPPRRYFFMAATRSGLPLDGLHSYDDAGARMRIKLLSLIPVVDLKGATLTRTETVTVLNDMAILAPAALIDPAIRWRQIDDQQVEASYTNGPHQVRAVLVFNDSGALVNFWSDDRPSLGPDGETLQPMRWSTPIGDYRQQGPWRLASRGEGRYAAPAGEYVYIELEGLSVQPVGATGQPTR
jgi:hypothetical protein